MITEKEPLTFREAPEVEAIALDLIGKHHPSLTNSRIVYLFRSEPEKVNGKTALGTARKVTGLNAFLANSFGEMAQRSLMAQDDDSSETTEAFFVMQVWEYGWTQLADNQRIALVDHELSHFFDEDGKLSILSHDLEEFIGVVHRHGLWYPDVEAFVKVAARKARSDNEDLFAEATSSLRVERGAMTRSPEWFDARCEVAA